MFTNVLEYLESSAEIFQQKLQFMSQMAKR